MENMHLKFDTLVNPELLISEIADKSPSPEAFAKMVIKVISWRTIVKSEIAKSLINESELFRTLFSSESVKPEKLIDLLLEKIPSECTIDGIKKLIACLVENYGEYIPKGIAPWQDSIDHHENEVLNYVFSKGDSSEYLLRLMMENLSPDVVLDKISKIRKGE